MGGLGAIGAALTQSMRIRGLEVYVSTSRDSAIEEFTKVLTHYSAVRLIAAGYFDLVINASGPGDVREGQHEWLEVTSSAQRVLQSSSTPGILLSSIRVFNNDGRRREEDDAGDSRNEYGHQNYLNELLWMKQDRGGANQPSRQHILRLCNVFIVPTSPNHPQNSLLPWSLIGPKDTWTNEIVVKSCPFVSRQFVNADDIANALLLIATNESSPRVCASVPGYQLTLGEIASLVGQVASKHQGQYPKITFGHDASPDVSVNEGWLYRAGWRSRLTTSEILRGLRTYMTLKLQ